MKHAVRAVPFGLGHPRLLLLLLLLLPEVILFLHPVACDEDEDTLLQGIINSYRTSLDLTPLAKNEKAGCLAIKIAGQLEDHPCTATTVSNAILGTGPQLASYPNLLSECDIHIDNTGDGVILPVCVHGKVPTLVLTNYTQTGYVMYLNESRFTGVGIGSEDDWTVVILTTSTQQAMSCPTCTLSLFAAHSED